MDTMQRLTLNIGGGDLRQELLEGIEHVVIPTSMIEEGVWEGNGGKLYYPADELEMAVPSYDAKPIVVYHPENEKGEPISACLPAILNTRKIGTILNTTHDNKMRCEAWIDPKKADAVDARIMQKIRKREKIEVSTGLRSHTDKIAGDFNGQPYEGIVRNIRGDHLAVLPDQLGAYSVKDGGGMFSINAAKNQPQSIQTLIQKTADQAMLAAGLKLIDNELSFGDIGSQLADLLSAKFGEPGKYWAGYICHIYGNYVIFSMPYKKVGSDMEPRYSKFAIDYTVKNDVVSLKGKETEVVEVTQYQTTEGKKTLVGNESGKLVILNQQEATMAFDKKAHIDKLIKAGVCVEGSRAKLDELSEDQLQLMVVPAAPIVENKGKETPTVVPPVDNAQPQFDKDTMAELLNNYQESRQEVIDSIVANSAGNYTKEELAEPKQWPMKQLRKLNKTLVTNAKAKKKGPDDDDDDDAGAKPIFTLNAGSGMDPLTTNELDDLPKLTPFDESSEPTGRGGKIKTKEQVA